MRFLKFIALFAATITIGLGIFGKYNPKPPISNTQIITYVKSLQLPSIIISNEIAADTADYPDVVQYAEFKRNSWTSAIALDSLSYLLADSLAPYWIGTTWDFNGVTKTPQKGEIACGYFVYGLLEDAGFSLPRIKLSQATSENSIKAIVNESYIKRFSLKAIDSFIEEMIAWGDGVYLVGLDYHIGIIRVQENQVKMIHSSVYPPVAVVIEDGNTSAALTYSDYRIVGKLNNPETIQKWLNGSYFSL